MPRYDFEPLDLYGDIWPKIPDTTLSKPQPMSMQQTLDIMKSAKGGLLDKSSGSSEGSSKGGESGGGLLDALGGKASVAKAGLSVIGKGIEATELQRQRALDSRLNQVLTTAAAMSMLGSGV